MAEGATETRRSSRIAAQPKKEEPVKPAKPARKTSTKKREVEATAAEAKDEPATKKVRGLYGL